MDLRAYTKRLIRASGYKIVPRTNMDHQMDLYSRLQVLLGALGKTDLQVGRFISDHRSAAQQKKALEKLSRNPLLAKLKKKRPLYFSKANTGFYSRIRKTVIRLTSSAGFGDLDADDILVNLMMGFNVKGDPTRKMSFVSAGYSLRSGIESGNIPLARVGNAIIGHAVNYIRTEISTRKSQRGPYDPIHVQPGMDDGLDTAVKHEISNFQSLGIKDKFEFLVDITLGNTVLGERIKDEILKIVSRLPRRQSEVGKVWLEHLLGRSAERGAFHAYGLGAELAKVFGIKRNTMSEHLGRITKAIANELPKNRKLMDDVERAMMAEEVSYGLKRAVKQAMKRGKMATRVASRFIKRYQKS